MNQFCPNNSEEEPHVEIKNLTSTLAHRTILKHSWAGITNIQKVNSYMTHVSVVHKMLYKTHAIEVLVVC